VLQVIFAGVTLCTMHGRPATVTLTFSLMFPKYFPLIANKVPPLILPVVGSTDSTSIEIKFNQLTSNIVNSRKGGICNIMKFVENYSYHYH